ncbi:MAG: phospho-sugar mutase [Pirellulaceae bacterium]
MNNQEAISAVQQAVEAQKLTPAAAKNMGTWLTETRYAKYHASIIEHIQAGKWQKLDDVFWTVIPFGTGGRRGRMYEFGSNAINERTIGESAQGLATYLLARPENEDRQLKCAIAYDTRHRSREFAELCASIMVANGFEVYFLDEYRATPQLSYAVRHFNCDCGIMVTASHNPPSDNAVKVYWSTGGQILPPHDQAIIDCVMTTNLIKRTDFAAAVSEEKVKLCTAESDRAYFAEVNQFAWPGPRDAKIIFSPLHGVGAFAVMPVLKEAGFADCEVYQRHAEPSGDFPNVPGHVSNPENKAVFDEIIQRAQSIGADVIIATDPDCDRLGVAAPLTTDTSGQWATINGNQIGALLTDFVCAKMKSLGKLTDKSYIIKTLVTTELSRRIAEAYSVRCEGNLHVGFKWIAGVMDAVGPEDFVFGTEESHGYLIGSYARDKDGAVACLLMCLLTAQLKSENKSLHERLAELQRQHGCHLESLINVQMEGSEGMAQMRKLMDAFRTAPPQQLGGIDVAQVRDYSNLTTRLADGSTQALEADRADMVMLDLAEEGNYFAVRPSGTEPKVKFYMFTYCSPADSQDLAAAQARLNDRLAALEKDIRSFVTAAIA